MCCNGVMSRNDVSPDVTADIAAIQQVKYRYLRALDTKHWDEFADTLTEDVVGDYGSSVGTELHFTNRTDLVDYMRSALGPTIITEHRVTHPEITVTADTATGRWYLQDRVIVAEANFMLIGAAFYRDQYRRTAAGWRISATGYDRTYEATMSLANIGFQVKPGRALAD
ncbi:nuclear transport factor 2 family protein [Mycobacterium marinum]|nr:nuclear transport factor 2 family protein [Mycobacterium marinum]